MTDVVIGRTGQQQPVSADSCEFSGIDPRISQRECRSISVWCCVAIARRVSLAILGIVRATGDNVRLTGTLRRVLILASVAGLESALAQTGPANFSGVWGPEDWVGWSVDQPFTPEGQALQDVWGPEHDTGLQCIYPLGRILSGMWLIEIVQTDGLVLVLYEFDNTVRRIYTDGREHIDTFPSLLGRSIGRWEGDTLVAETLNLESGFVRYQGLPYTRDLRLTERYNLSEDASRLTVEYTFDDPNYYREPWTVSRIYVPTDDEIRDSGCTVRAPLPAVAAQ